jgi:hypothetical protein
MKQIPGYPDYFIDECGNVDSHRRGKVKRLKAVLSKVGYYCYSLYSIDGSRAYLTVHRLVASAHLGESDLHVLHNDGDKTNNCVSNLRYGTHSDNIIDASKHGTHNTRKLSDDDVKTIRESSESYRSLGRQYGVAHQTISRLKRGLSLAHVQ